MFKRYANIPNTIYDAWISILNEAHQVCVYSAKIGLMRTDGKIRQRFCLEEYEVEKGGLKENYLTNDAILQERGYGLLRAAGVME